MADVEPSFTNMFPSASTDSWRELALAGLKGAPFAKLETQTPEGLKLNPLYTQADSAGNDTAGFPGYAPFTRGNRLLGNAASGWEIHQSIGGETIDSLIAGIQNGLGRGVKSVWLNLDQSQFTKEEWSRLLESIPDGAHGIGLETGATPLSAAALLSQNSNRQWTGSINADPIGSLAAQGALPRSLASALDEVACLHRWCDTNQPNLRTVRVSTVPYHQAGANGVQELAIGLSTGVHYLRELSQRGLAVDSVIPKMGFQFAIGRNVFMEVAKLRAARLLWTKVVQACTSESHEGMWIHAITSPVTLTKRDPWVNMLRTTAGAFAASTGGANQITTAPFDEAIGPADDFSQRIASHTQVILEEESHLGAVIDPAGGSWYIESLTDELAKSAWKEFQRLEAAGGIATVLESGTLQNELEAQWATRRKAVECRKEPITGVSEFPNLDEKPIEKEAADIHSPPATGEAIPENVFKAIADGSANAVDLLANAWSNAATVAALEVGMARSEEQASITPLAKHTLAEPFESLRDQSDAALADSGSRPSVFLANLGTIPQHKARATFAKNFFETGGFHTHSNDGFDSLDSLVEAFKESAAPVAVLCSTDAVYTDQAVVTAAALKTAGAKAIVLAGRLGDNEDAFTQAGITTSIYMGCNVYETLHELLQTIGVLS